jgi:hypothetical protein
MKITHFKKIIFQTLYSFLLGAKHREVNRHNLKNGNEKHKVENSRNTAGK